MTKTKTTAKQSYTEFLAAKTQTESDGGFKPLFLPDYLFDFQRHLVDWAVRKGRAAIYADCGLGKTPMQLVVAQNIVQKTNKPVLILTPIAVGRQTIHEAEKFGVEAYRCQDGKLRDKAAVVVTNYQRLHYFNASDFGGAICDESSILKNFDGAIKAQVTEFMRTLPYRGLYTATAAPNDYIELGTSSEALGELGFTDMLTRFFKKEGSTTSRSDEYRTNIWRFRGHAERDFWRWVCSWARAIRKPSDFGYEDHRFVLPPLVSRQHVVQSRVPKDGYLFDLPAVGLKEQREERRRTLQERCEMAAEIINQRKGQSVAWCYLNSEGDLLERMIKNCAQVSGDDPEEKQEETFEAFEKGQVKCVVTKPTIAGFGLNWAFCNHQTWFPSHSYEQYYQGVRRSWRFGQKQEVTVDVICSEGESSVLASIERKTQAAEAMFTQLVTLMNSELQINTNDKHNTKERLPKWL